MSKRAKIRVFSFAAVLVLVLGGFYVESHSMLLSSRAELEYSYRRALNDLTSYVSDMQYSLKKATYANTATMQNGVSAKLLEQSSGAKAAMATLPFSAEKTENISRFVSQVGDYAMAISRKASTGAQITNEEYQNLNTMEEYAKKLSEALEEVQAHLSVEKAEIGKTQRLLNNVDEVDSVPNFDDSLDEVAKEFNEYPELLYDGPFSDHVIQRESLYLKGKDSISSNDAKKIAAEFLGCNESELQESATVENSLPSYVYTWDQKTVQVTKSGGEISYYKHTETIENQNLSYEDALKKATEFLDKLGIASYKESYYIINDNTCTINFSYLDTQGDTDVICYPDLLKVVVELDHGDIVEYDPDGYLMNHHEREISEPEISLDEAKSSVSANLTIESHELAIIPTAGLDEVYCYEFKCTDKNDIDVLIYINAKTGLEEQIFILTYSDNGILTI